MILGSNEDNNYPQLHPVSFLLENDRFSYIIQYEKNKYKKEALSASASISGSYIDRISARLNETGFFNEKYSFIDISVLNDKFTLIPLEHFDESLAEAFLNQTVPYSKNMDLRFNLIPQFDLVLVFYSQGEIENLFSPVSEKIRITHTGFKLLSKIKNGERRNGIFLNTYQDCFELAIVENDRLILYNIFPYVNKEDIVYFLQAVSKAINIRLSLFMLYYYGNLEEKPEDLNYLSTYFRGITPGTEDNFERENFTILDLV